MKDQTHKKKPNQDYETMFQYAQTLGFGELHMKMDQETGLQAIVAIHSTKLGPAIGGCRCISYKTTTDATRDALRLAQMMTLKAAVSELPHGGGKSVLIKPKKIENREKYFEAFGKFVDDLNGKYITAVDSGTSTDDMDAIAKKTGFVTCTKRHLSKDGDPSSFTARGVIRGIEAAVNVKFNRNDIEGIHVAIQGAGHVGYHLAKELYRKGAKITMCDLNSEALELCVDEFKVKTVKPNSIFKVDCDVFSPCALGGALNKNNIKKLKAAIVAGSANNQLEKAKDGILLHKQGILYAPDFVINAGGLIRVATTYDHESPDKADHQIHCIYDKIKEILERSNSDDIPASVIAVKLANEYLNK